MILFWVFAALMIAAGLAIVLPALWSRDAAPGGVQGAWANGRGFRSGNRDSATPMPYP